jgi:hypothetical protein
MALVFDTKTTVKATSAVSKTIINSGSARVMVAGIVNATVSARSGGAPTYNGVSFTLVGSIKGVAECNTELWYLLDPATGSNSFALANTKTSNTRTIVSVYAGATNCVFYKANTDVATNHANPSVTITNVPDGAAVVDIFGSGYANVMSSASHTTLYLADETAWGTAGQYTIKSGVGNITTSYKQISDDVAYWAIAFREITAAAATGGVTINMIPLYHQIWCP